MESLGFVLGKPRSTLQEESDGQERRGGAEAAGVFPLAPPPPPAIVQWAETPAANLFFLLQPSSRVSAYSVVVKYQRREKHKKHLSVCVSPACSQCVPHLLKAKQVYLHKTYKCIEIK